MADMNATWEPCDLTQGIPHEDGAFDVAFEWSVLLHILDDEKFERANKRKNTEKTMTEIEDVTGMGVTKLRAYAKEEGLTFDSKIDKKELLELLEKEGKLY